jgi:hypothetical protein
MSYVLGLSLNSRSGTGARSDRSVLGLAQICNWQYWQFVILIPGTRAILNYQFANRK